MVIDSLRQERRASRAALRPDPADDNESGLRLILSDPSS
jgi:hypothetical protein